ncbi:hypothetical protein DFH09DRAFT_1309782 [Mycena vulgaris]|nr:hypothetical protein DFH09DRAFT_1309782 [Mycena vulgaris]
MAVHLIVYRGGMASLPHTTFAPSFYSSPSLTPTLVTYGARGKGEGSIVVPTHPPRLPSVLSSIPRAPHRRISLSLVFHPSASASAPPSSSPDAAARHHIPPLVLLSLLSFLASSPVPIPPRNPRAYAARLSPLRSHHPPVLSSFSYFVGASASAASVSRPSSSLPLPSSHPALPFVLPSLALPTPPIRFLPSLCPSSARLLSRTRTRIRSC